MRGLAAIGHEVLFLEREQSWYANNRDLPVVTYGHVHQYGTFSELKNRFARQIRDADLVILGSYVPEGIELARWITSVARGIVAFYDIDTPVTIAKMAAGQCDYISRELVPRFDLYLSFTGGPLLRRIEKEFGARRAVPLYCSVDPLQYFPQKAMPCWDLGYMGTYSDDRQPLLEQLLLHPARRWTKGKMVVAGPQYPPDIRWPENVQRIIHLAPADHRRFYAQQRFTLNITRSEMRRTGYSPSVRLFEAAACATPIISDQWRGLSDFFQPGKEVLTVRSGKDVLAYLHDLPEEKRIEIGLNARRRVMRQHTAMHRANELHSCVSKLLGHGTAKASAGELTAQADPLRPLSLASG